VPAGVRDHVDADDMHREANNFDQMTHMTRHYKAGLEKNLGF